jgi:hypothetical protein
MGVKVRITEDPTIGMLRRTAFAMLEQRGRQRDLFDVYAVFAAACVYGFPLDRGQGGADGARPTPRGALPSAGAFPLSCSAWGDMAKKLQSVFHPDPTAYGRLAT